MNESNGDLMRGKYSVYLRLSARALASGIASILLILMLVGCGSKSTTSTTATPTPTPAGGMLSGIKKRVLLSNENGSGTVTPPTGVSAVPGLQILDAEHDVASTFDIAVPGPGKLVTASGLTAVIDETENAITIVNNAQEAVAQTFGTPNLALDIALTPSGDTAFAAVRNPGVLDVITTSNDAGAAVTVPTITRLVMSPNGTMVLAFVDNPQDLADFPQNSFFVINVATNQVTPIARPNSCTSATACDLPYTAVFNGSDTNAFILNCGAECGGTTASVVSIDFSNPNAPVFGTVIPVSGATVGALVNSNLFVAGTPPGGPPGAGTLQVINTGTSTASAPVTITDGTHGKMVMASNNRLYVGATTCTAVNDQSTGLIRGCLTIFNTQTSATVFPEFSPLRVGFDVTGIQPISNRTVVYVIDGGSLDIFDTTTDQLFTTQIEIVGKAVDLVQIDP